MDLLIDEIKSNRDVRDTTLKIYKTNLNKLAMKLTGDKYKNIDFLKDYDKVKEYLEDKSNSNRKKILSSILIALNPKKGEIKDNNEKLYNKYKILLNKENDVYLNQIRDNNKTEHDEKNWIEWEKIINEREKLLKQIKARNIKLTDAHVKNKKDFLLVQDYLISSLYTYLPPRRLEYADTIVISEPEFKKTTEKEKDDNIYLVNKGKTKKYFSFGKNAIKSETLENLQVDVPKELNKILNLWLSINKTKNLLVNNNMTKLTKNNLTKKLKQIFKDTDKDISVVLLRKIFLSHKFGDDNKERKEISKLMNHDISTQGKFYIKDN